MPEKPAPKVQLLSVRDCPNVEAARENLRSALSSAGLKPVWKEVDLDAGTVHDAWKGFPSPTVLVAGADVMTHAESAPGVSACRLGGAPSAAAILSALRRGTDSELARAG